MTEKGWIIAIMWVMWGVAATALALGHSEDAGLAPTLVALILAILTFKLLKK